MVRTSWLGPRERWPRLAARLLVFLGIPVLLVGTGYLLGVHRGRQLATERGGATAVPWHAGRRIAPGRGPLACRGSRGRPLE